MRKRQFMVAIVGLMGSKPFVSIREVKQDGGFTHDRDSAWAHAMKLRQPRGKRKSALPVHFTGLDGMTTELEMKA